MAARSLNPDKIAYGPQVKTVVKQLSTLKGEALEAYVEQQRRMVQDTLNVTNHISFTNQSLTVVARSLSEDITLGR